MWLKATAVLVAVIYGVLEEVTNQQGEEAIALALCAWSEPQHFSSFTQRKEHRGRPRRWGCRLHAR